MAKYYEKQKEETPNAIDFIEVRKAQQAAEAIVNGSITSPLPYDVEKKRTIEQHVEVEQRPK